MLLFFSLHKARKKKPQAGWKLPLCWPGYHSPSDWDVSGTDWGPIAGTSSGQMAPNWSPERTKTLCNNVWPTQHASKTLETPRMNREKHYTIMGNIFQELHDPRSGSGTHTHTDTQNTQTDYALGQDTVCFITFACFTAENCCETSSTVSLNSPACEMGASRRRAF